MQLHLNAEELVGRLLSLAVDEQVSILDSCNIGYLGSHLLIAGIEPVRIHEFSHDDPDVTLRETDELLSADNALIFTISYDFGRKLLSMAHGPSGSLEPDLFAAAYDVLIVHDYVGGTTRLIGDPQKLPVVERKLQGAADVNLTVPDRTRVTSDFGETDYLAAIAVIQARIRAGDTYQTNLTQQLTAKLADGIPPEIIFARLRRDHPAPFASFIKRTDSTVVSASPERFFTVRDGRIETSPIKGTRPRGRTPEEDRALRDSLLKSRKDRAENTMIVDLLRNDLGRVCQFGSVRVEKLCELEEHPTFFHLVSTVAGELRPKIQFAELLKAVFPCGSITGAPKISTMRIIDEIETSSRGLSMGAIGYYATPRFGLPAKYDLSVAIRTMVIRDQLARFNVGGGVTIDSDPTSEYEESLLKAKALLSAINGTISS